ncbi:MAG: uridine kinase [Pseudonocardia sp.]|nr:uridine kinase [Pseudonocardia sp.]
MIDALVARVLAAPTRCGRTKLVCLDGPSGGGKTQLAAALAEAIGDPPVVGMDELYPGWDGLAAGVARLREEIVAPLAARRAVAYRRWDWARDTYGEPRDLGVPPLLVVEGVGAGAAPGFLIWLDAAEEVRYRRAMERDGDGYAPYWARWAAQERAHFAADRTAERADVRLTTG